MVNSVKPEQELNWLVVTSYESAFPAAPVCPVVDWHESITHQNLRRWFSDGRQNVDALGGEITVMTSPQTFSVTPARVDKPLTAGILLENEQVALLERQERRTIG